LRAAASGRSRWSGEKGNKQSGEGKGRRARGKNQWEGKRGALPYQLINKMCAKKTDSTLRTAVNREKESDENDDGAVRGEPTKRKNEA